MHSYRQDLENGETELVMRKDFNQLVTDVLLLRVRRKLKGNNRKDTYNDVLDATRGKKTVRKRKTQKSQITIAGAWAAARAAVKNVSRDTVSHEEMKRRLRICHKCPVKMKVADCTGG